MDPSNSHLDLYSVLGVARDADIREIKRAHRALVKEYHPDVNDDDSAKHRFHQIQAAFEVLGDSDARAAYDRQRCFSHSDGLGDFTSDPYYRENLHRRAQGFGRQMRRSARVRCA